MRLLALRLKTGMRIAGRILTAANTSFSAQKLWRAFFTSTKLFGKFTVAAIALPAILLLDLVSIAYTIWSVFSAPKLTAFNISNLSLEILKAALMVPVALSMLGVIALPALASSIVFITALSIGAVYNGILAGIHAW